VLKGFSYFSFVFVKFSLWKTKQAPLVVVSERTCRIACVLTCSQAWHRQCSGASTRQRRESSRGNGRRQTAARRRGQHVTTTRRRGPQLRCKKELRRRRVFGPPLHRYPEQRPAQDLCRRQLVSVRCSFF